LVLAVLSLTGRLGPLLAEPAGRIVLVAGLALEAIGAAIVAVMVRKAGR
jgi:Flp pilus assembly protein TadB